MNKETDLPMIVLDYLIIFKESTLQEVNHIYSVSKLDSNKKKQQ